MKTIIVSDLTLKKLEAERTAPLLFKEKTALALCADDFGADRIELPPVARPEEDPVVYRTVCGRVRRAAVAIPVGATEQSLQAAYECVRQAKQPVLQVEMPVSAVQMEYEYHLKGPAMLEKIAALCAAAKATGATVEFVARDATRAEPAFLLQALQTACEAGADEVTLCDTAGLLLPQETAALVAQAREAVQGPLYWEACDALDMATANALAALQAGADGLKAAMMGTHVLPVDRLADALAARGEDMGVCAGLDGTRIHHDVAEMRRQIEKADGSVAEEAKGRDILLDKDSTLAHTARAVRELGYELTDEDMGRVYEALRRVCEKKPSVGARELEAIVASSAMQAPSTYHLESYLTSSSNLTPAMAHVVLAEGEQTLSGVASGDGPIDCAFNAIEQIVGFQYELDDFQIRSVTEGREALGEAVVRLRSNGKLYSGVGLSANIVGASIRAYVNALNKIVYEEKKA